MEQDETRLERVGWEERNEMIGPKLNIGAVVVVAGLALGAGASAGDFYERCADVEGDFVIESGVLIINPNGPERGETSSFDILEETILRSESGYCESNASPGMKFPYEFRASAITVRVEMRGGEPAVIDMICQHASSGLPAAYNCDRNVPEKKGGAHSE